MESLFSDRRDFLRALIGGAAGLSITYRAAGQPQQPPQPPRTPIKATKITERIAFLSGDGGNVGLVIADDGLMMIDGGYANRAEELQKAIAGVDSHPVKILFNTHWHSDHVGSNELLGKSGVKIIAHQNAKHWLSQRVNQENFNMIVEPLKPEGLPSQTFVDGGKMTFGKEKIEYKWVPYSHTDNDAYLFFPSANVLQTGDLFFAGMYPVIDYSTGGWIGGMLTALEKLQKAGDAKTQIIPGHGPLATKDDVKAAHEMIRTVCDRIKPFSARNAGIDEVVKANLLEDLDPKWGHGILSGERFLRMAYPSIARHTQMVKTTGHGKTSW